MGNFLNVFIFLNLMSSTLGQELTLDRDITVEPGRISLCGVLTCNEVTSSSATSKGCPEEGKTSFRSISSMKIFYRDLTKVKNTEIVALTEKYPKIDGVAYRFTVQGLFETGGASLQLDLAKEKDCLSEFTCEVQGVDEAGKEVISSVTLLPQPAQAGGGNQASSGGLMSAVSLQLLNQVQQLNTKLSVLANSMDGWEEKSDAVEKSMAEKIAATERQLEEKIESLDDKLDQSVDRIEDRVDNNVVGELEILDLKLSALTGHEVLANSEASTILPDNFTALKRELQNEQSEALEKLANNSLTIERALSTTAQLVHRIQNGLGEVNLCDKPDFSLIITNFTEQLSKVSIPGDPLKEDIIERILAAQKNLSQTLETIEKVIEEEGNQTQSDFKQLLVDLNQHITINETCIITNPAMPKSCHEGMTSVFYEGSYPYPVIVPSEESDLAVPYLCDTSTDGGGWIIIQRRATGETNFTRDWESYKQGFGTLSSDFWLGNDNIHTLTSKGTWELRVDIQYKDKSAYAHYASFSIGSEADKYKLSVKTCDGTAGDSLAYHNNMKFSTYDQDNDLRRGGTPCSVQEHGGWWFGNCDMSNLNGKWGEDSDYGIEWTSYIRDVGMTFSEMKIRQAE